MDQNDTSPNLLGVVPCTFHFFQSLCTHAEHQRLITPCYLIVKLRRLLMWVSRTTLCDKVCVCITKLSTSIQNFKSCHNDIPNIMCMSKDNYLHHLLITNTSNSNMYYKTLSMSNNLSSSFSIMMYAFHFDIRIHFAY